MTRNPFPPKRSFGPWRSFLQVLAALPLLAAAPATAQANPFDATWPNTDFSRLAIDLGEVVSGGPPRDGIPAILDPSFIRASEETRLDDREPVMTYMPDDGAARAYPIRYLMWHEIVNDVVMVNRSPSPSARSVTLEWFSTGGLADAR